MPTAQNPPKSFAPPISGMDARCRLRCCIFILFILVSLMLLAPAGCFASGSDKKPTPEQIAQAENEAKRIKEEQDRREMEARKKKHKQAIINRVRGPYGKILAGDTMPPEPIRVAVLGSPLQPGTAQRIGLLLGSYQHSRLEKNLGAKVFISYVSLSPQKNGGKSLIHYRPDFLKAALQVASVMPQTQVVEPMSEEELQRSGVDVLVYLSDKLR